MTRFATILIVALIAFQGVVGKPKKQQAQPQQSQLEELAANAQVVVQNVTRVLGVPELPDSKKVIDDLKTNTQTLADNVLQAVEKLKGELKAHQGDVENVLKQVEQKLSETVTQLQQAAGPEATAKAKELGDNLDNGLKTVVGQVEKLIKAVEPDATKARNDIQNAAKTLLDQVVDIGNNVQNQVKATIAEHEKTHKH